MHGTHVEYSERRSPARAADVAAAVVWLAGLAAFAVQVARVHDFTIDDAFMVFRYAENLAAGRGPTFHLDGTPTEGVTQVVWLLWLTIPHLLGLDVVGFAKLCGVVFTLATAERIARLAARMATDAGRDAPAARLAGAAGAAAFLALPFTALHAVAGLGTAWFCLVLTAAVGVADRFRRDPSRGRALAVGAVGFLAGLSRPEGNAFAGLLAIALAVAVPANARWTLARGIALGHLLPGLAWFALRYGYYGLPMPLPYYVKMQGGAEFAAAIDTGASLALQLGQFLGPVWVAPLVAAAVVGRGWLSVATLLVGAAFFAVQTAPLQLMGYGFRYFFPALAVLAAPVGFGALALGRAAPAGVGRSVVTVVLAGGLVLGAVRGSRVYLDPWQHYAVGLRQAHVALGERLAAFPVVGAVPTLAISDAGAVPYLSRYEAIDLLGLNDPVIARQPEQRVARVLAARPDLIVLLSSDPATHAAILPWEASVWTAALGAGYTLVETASFSATYHLLVLGRSDAPVTAWLAATPRAAGG